jgi:hypothetical protein
VISRLVGDGGALKLVFGIGWSGRSDLHLRKCNLKQFFEKLLSCGNFPSVAPVALCFCSDTEQIDKIFIKKGEAGGEDQQS